MTEFLELASQFRQDLIDGDATAVSRLTARYSELINSLNSSIELLAQEIEHMVESGESVPRWRLERLNRYQSLLAQALSEMSMYNQLVASELESATDDSRDKARDHAVRMVSAVTGGERVAVNFDQLPSDAIERLVSIAQGGQPLNEILTRAYPIAVEAITDKLVSAIATGRNPRTAVRQAVKQGLGQGFNHLLLVFRDQQIRHYREMTRGIYDRSDVVYGYKRLAAKNNRTCLACLALDGTIYETRELMPLHPQDRCTMIPLVRGFDVPSFQTGEDWFISQSRSVQRDMMGRKKYDAWQSGAFTFDQLATIRPNETWGATAVVTPLKDLIGR